MYDIYIKNYTDGNGVVQTTETLLYSIPISSQYKDNVLIDPAVKAELGKSGTFEFSINPDNPYYNCWRQMKTIMRVVYDGDTIFRGRALTIDNTLWGDKKLHFESDFAFFMDSYQVGTKEEKRTTITILAYLQQIINAHNTQMQEASESDKYFMLGEVPGQYSNAIADAQKVKVDATKKYGSDSWETSMNALESLQKQYGGYFRTRYVNGTCYLDWLDGYYRDATNTTQVIEIGENLIELQDSAEVENIFTALVPLGSGEGKEVTIETYKTNVHGSGNNRILVPQIVSEFTDVQLNSGYHSKEEYQNAVNKYGIIYKTQKFDNADTPQKLWEYACDYILRNYMGGISSFTITALDMHHIDGVVEKYLVGDKIPLRYPDLDSRANSITPIITKTLTATSITYKLHDPDKNDYTIGIPNSLVEKKYGSSNGKGGGGSGGGGKKEVLDDDFERSFDKDTSDLGGLAWQFVINEKYNNLEYQMLLAQDPDLQYVPWVLKTAKTIIKEAIDPHAGPLQRTANSILIESGKIEMQAKLGPLWQSNPLYEQALKSVDSIVIDAFNNQIEFKQHYNGQEFRVLEDNPLKTSVVIGSTADAGLIEAYLPDHLKEDANPILSAMLDGSDGTIASIINKLGLDGSGEKATIISSGLTSMLQFFAPNTVTTPTPTETAEVDGTNGKAKVGKDGNGDWQVELNKTVTYTDAQGQTQIADGFVSAKDFNIPTVASFKTKMAVVDTLLADYASINSLYAMEASIEQLEADALTATTLTAQIINAAIVNADISALSGTFSGNLSCGTLLVSNGIVLGQTNISNPVLYVTLTPPSSGSNQYKLTATTADGNYNDMYFSRATSLSGEWSGSAAAGKSYKVEADPQGNVHYSPALDMIYFSGDKTWATNNLSFDIRINVDDEQGETLMYDTLTFSIADKFETVSLQTINTGSVLRLQQIAGARKPGTVVKYDRGTKSTIIPGKNPVYFKLHTSGTPTGNWYEIVPKTSSYTNIWYTVDTQIDHYPGNGGSFTVQGDAISGDTFEEVDTGGTNYYQANSATNYYRIKVAQQS